MKRIPSIKQHDKSDCAVACIGAIAMYYGLKLPLITIRDACGASMQGTTLKGIIDGCQAVGLQATACRSTGKDLSGLEMLDAPAVLHMEKENGDLHFVVLCGKGRSGFDIMDPGPGKHVTVSGDWLVRNWTGYLILIKPGPYFTGGDRTQSAASRIIPLMIKHRKELALSIAASVLYIAAGISSSLFLQHIIDNVLPNGAGSALYLLLAAMTAIAAVCFLAGYVRITNVLRAATGIDMQLVGDYLSHLFKLPMKFFATRGTGELNSRIGDAMKIRTFIVETVTALAISAITLILSFILMFTFHWKLASFTLMFMPAYCVLYFFADKVNSRMNREIIERNALFEQECVEAISSYREIKYTECENITTAALKKSYLHLTDKMYKGGQYGGLFALSSDAVSALLTTMILCVGASFIFSGTLSIGQLVSFYAISAYFSGPLNQLVGINGEIAQMKVAAQRLFEIMDLDGEDAEGLKPSLEKSHDIVLDGITFSYPGCLPLIQERSMTFEAGKITALTGESGCGKSTIAALLMRAYAPQEGSITIKGLNINLIDMQLWRRYVGIVTQEPRLRDATILENITGSEPSPDIEKAIRLLAELGMAEFVQGLPLGILTKAGQGGCLLSGGQKQRIALARALYRDPQILILDEATSSLDKESEQCILSKARVLRDEGKTIIMITHKEDNCAIADKVIDMSGHS